MEINVQLTEDIINQSMKMHYANAPAKQRYSLLYVPAALSFVGLYFLINELFKPQFGTTGWLGIFYQFMAVGLYYYLKRKREHTGKYLLKAMAENAAFDMEVNDEVLVTKLSDSTLSHQWTAFHKAIVGRDIVLLYQGNQSFTMFGRSFFANDDFDRFKKMVKEHVMEVKEV
ncbi:MAG: hypothetical protein V4722_02090 [Bacteroidota bacterium]